MYYKKSKPTLKHMTTQSSISSTSSAKSWAKRNSQNATQNEDTVPTSPSCAQLVLPTVMLMVAAMTPALKSPDQMIEVSDGKRKRESTDNDMVEVVKMMTTNLVSARLNLEDLQIDQSQSD